MKSKPVTVWPDRTPNGVWYYKGPCAALLAETNLNMDALWPFLQGFGEDLWKYMEDKPQGSDSEMLAKIAGQICYMSFDEKRTKNAQIAKYLTHIKESGHGSVLEHASATLLLWGIDRAVTHELVRHRAGMAYSQVSQRYCSGKTLRFVEHPIFQADPKLHEEFIARIEKTYADYTALTEELYAKQAAGDEALSDEFKTGLRKKVQQVARAVLTNDTEAPIVVTGNMRAWRHFLEMRSSEAADVQIRRLANAVFKVLSVQNPILFADYQRLELVDGTFILNTPTKKV